MTSSIIVEPYETVEFSDSDTDSWQVVDPFDSENDDVITTESDVITSDEDDDVDVDEEEQDEDVDVVVDDVIPTESDVVSSEYEEDDEEEEEEDDDEDEEDDDVISSDEEEEEEDDVITSEDEEEDEEDDEDVITPMSSDEITNRTQGLNKAAMEFEGLYNVEISDSMKEDFYWERMRLERALYEEEEEEEDEDEDYDEEDLDDELIPRWLNNKFERQRMRKLGKKVYPKMKKSKRMVNQYNRPGCAGAKHGLGLKHNLI